MHDDKVFDPDHSPEHIFNDAAMQDHWADVEDIAQKRDDTKFVKTIDTLIDDAEQMRLKFMAKHRMRGFISTTLGLIAIFLGTAGFGWFLLMDADLVKAAACVLLALFIPFLLHLWSQKTIGQYVRAYKLTFMPEIAKAMGLKFNPFRGISAKILPKTGILPHFTQYEAEDCFMGRHKGVKVMFSEATLLDKKGGKVVFDGVFVLMETKEAHFKGHTILSADKNMVRHYAKTRWNKLTHIPVQAEKVEWDRFEAYSDDPAHAQKLISQSLLKELSELSDVFDESPLSVAMFKQKYVFMAIPYAHDMFEPSNVHVPVTTTRHALTCKKEVERLMEIIDVFEVYKP